MLFQNIQAFFHKYDPKRFSFFYAFKALLALVLGLLIAYSLNLDKLALIFLSLTCMFIFFMNNFQSSGRKRFLYLLLFLALICGFLPFAQYFASLGIYLIFPSFAWVFLMSLAPLISNDLSKITLFSTLFSFALLLVCTQYHINAGGIFIAILIGFSSCIIFRFISFRTYGGYTRRSLVMILDDLIYTTYYMPDERFKYWRLQAIKHIDEMALVCNSSAGTIKDASLIKHQERALFYLYKCEEIAIALLSLRVELRKYTKKDKKILKELQNEIIFNLNELKTIFLGGETTLKDKAFKDFIKDGRFFNAHATLRILYQKLDLFYKGAINKTKLQILTEDKEKLNIKELLKKLNFENEIVRYALKVALAVSFALFISSIFELNHGIWISVYIFSIMRVKTSSVRLASVQNLIGLILGLCIGIGTILVFKNTMIFPFILLLAYFCAIYFTFFTNTLAVTFITACLCIYYSFISDDYMSLITIRSVDILLSLIIAMSISYLLWPSKSEEALKTMFLELLKDLHKLLQKLGKEDFLSSQHKIFEDIESFSALSNELKDTKKYKLYSSMLLMIENTNLALSNLAAKQASLDKAGKTELASDIKVLLIRFNMLDNKAKKRAFYFYPAKQLKNSFISKDKEALKLLLYIGLEQNKAHKIINKAWHLAM